MYRPAGPINTFHQLAVGWSHFYKYLYMSGEPEVRRFLTELCGVPQSQPLHLTEDYNTPVKVLPFPCHYPRIEIDADPSS